MSDPRAFSLVAIFACGWVAVVMTRHHVEKWWRSRDRRDTTWARAHRTARR